MHQTSVDEKMLSLKIIFDGHKSIFLIVWR